MTLAQQDVIDYSNNNTNNPFQWKTTIYVYRLKSLLEEAFSLCPLGFVLERLGRRCDLQQNEDNELNNIPAVIIHFLNKNEESISSKRSGSHSNDSVVVPSSLSSNTYSYLFQSVHDKLEVLLLVFATSTQQKIKN